MVFENKKGEKNEILSGAPFPSTIFFSKQRERRCEEDRKRESQVESLAFLLYQSCILQKAITTFSIMLNTQGKRVHMRKKIVVLSD